MKIEQIESIVSTQETFDSYAKELGTHPTNVAIELIGLAYKLDGDDLTDDDLLELIAEILKFAKNSTYKGE
jgi:UDP-N-acetyl-D-mannosaminuronate dehydrogenase